MLIDVMGTETSQSVRLRHGDPADRISIVRWIVLIFLGLCTVFCVFWLCAAIWELVSMSENAYGRHTAKFRASYFLSGALAVLLGTIAVIAGFLVKCGRRFVD